MHIICADKNYQIRLQIFFYVILHIVTPSGVIQTVDKAPSCEGAFLVS